jgi:hypothetical protein
MESITNCLAIRADRCWMCCATNLICALRIAAAIPAIAERARCGSTASRSPRVWYWPPIVRGQRSTVEASISGELHPVQRALVEQGGIQCGFCTPGIVMLSIALLRDNPHPTEDEVRLGLAGNLCRCTGYKKIVEAVMSVKVASIDAIEHAIE